MSWLKKAWDGLSWLGKVLVALGAVLVFIVGYAVLKEWNVGGFIAGLFDKEPSDRDKVKVANTVPDERVDKAGAPISIGTPDDKGFTQWNVHETEISSNPFRDKSKIKVVSTVEVDTVDGGKRTEKVIKEIALPKGVKDKDVSKVVEVKPDIFVVEVVDTSGVSAADLLDEL